MRCQIWMLFVLLIIEERRYLAWNPVSTSTAASSENVADVGLDPGPHAQAAFRLRDLFKRTLLPWQQPPDFAPQYLQHVNNLTALIDSQRHPNVTWLTVFALTELGAGSYSYRVLLNTLTTYLLLGRGKSYVVLVATTQALATCMSLRLPCYNATGIVPAQYMGSYIGGTWAKVFMCRLALHHLPPDLDLHVSDHDVIYLKKIYPSIAAFAANQSFDLAGQMEDYPVPGLNTGVLFMRNTPRLRDMYDRWLQLANNETHDQEAFMRAIGHMVYVQPPGLGPPVSLTAASVVRHNAPWTNGHWCHWCEDDYGNCWKTDDSRHCELPQRLYIHAICVADKIRFMDKGLGLYFLDRHMPLATNYTAIAVAGLPCPRPRDVAALQYIPMGRVRLFGRRAL